MSFIEPNLGQVQKNQKILQELEEKKRRMRSSIPDLPSPNSSPSPSSFSAIQSQPITQTELPPPPIVSSAVKPSFTLFTSSNTVGYFITTDSTFGNQILPVLPRF